MVAGVIFVAKSFELVNFPAKVDPDHIAAVWSDRIITAWFDACQLIDSVYNGDATFGGATQESFMAFAKAVAKVINFKYEVTGARVTPCICPGSHQRRRGYSWHDTAISTEE